MSDLKMPFGKHKGENIDKVPASYLMWAHDEGILENYEEVADYVEKNIKGLRQDAKKRWDK